MVFHPCASDGELKSKVNLIKGTVRAYYASMSLSPLKNPWSSCAYAMVQTEGVTGNLSTTKVYLDKDGSNGPAFL